MHPGCHVDAAAARWSRVMRSWQPILHVFFGAGLLSGIYSQHQHGEPSLANFMRQYGATMQRKLVDLPRLSAHDVCATILDSKPTSAGMDGFMPIELKHLVLWSPSHIACLTQLLQKVEATGIWPRATTVGAVAFVAKDPSQIHPEPGDYRPITILSAVYRAWAACRHKQLAALWLPHWQHAGTYGLPGGRAADVLAYETCAQVLEASANGQVAAGLSYDLRKCFDTVPVTLALQVMRQRGADNNVLRAMEGFYSAHTKHFRIEGAYSKAFTPHNGIVQGCPLSMMVLVSLITNWLEFVQSQVPEATPRSYADDLSVCAQHARSQIVKQRLRQVHEHTDHFVQLSGMVWHRDKSFIFGPKEVQNAVPAIKNYCTNFRLVGGSVKLAGREAWTPLEQDRCDRWEQTATTVEYLPVGWFTKVRILRSTMPKLTFGQGTHVLPVARDRMRHLRAVVVRPLFGMNDYSLSPQAVFAILAPPSLEPAYALQCSAFQLVQRVYDTAAKRSELSRKLARTWHADVPDGPIARVLQLRAHPVFGPFLKAFLRGSLHASTWPHESREAWRAHTWKTLARERSQHFQGAQHNIDRSRTLALLNELTAEADSLQLLLDQSLATPPLPEHDPRAKLKVLRLLLTAGLMTPERDHRHRRQAGVTRCACGRGAPTIEHISWKCGLFKEQRAPAQRIIARYRRLPTCFRLCTLVPSSLRMPVEEVKTVQAALLKIWQRHISDWGDDPTDPAIIHLPSVPPAASSSSDHHEPPPVPPQDDPQLQPMSRNGHVLQLLPTGGAFCRKCGKQTKIIKHLRLKILGKRCKFASLPPQQWLDSPGALRSEVKIAQLETEMNSRYNHGHSLVWNRLQGKEASKSDYGLIWCTQCGRTWPWKHRHSNLGRTTCTPCQPPPQAPAWVVAFRASQPSTAQPSQPSEPPTRPAPSPLAAPNTVSPHPPLHSDAMIVSRPRRRVFGKSTVARVPDDAVPNSSRRRIWSKRTVPTVSEHVLCEVQVHYSILQ